VINLGNYLRGEIYRISRKKSLYIYFASVALFYFLLVFIRLGGAEQMLADARATFQFLPPVVGGYLFAVIYNDDLHSKNLSVLIGFGLSKVKIILSKFLLIVLSNTLIIGLAPLVMAAAYTVFGAPADLTIAAALPEVYVWGLKALMESVAFATLSGIVVYGLQRATFSMVTYLMLSLYIVSQLVGLLLNWEMIASIAPGLPSHLITGISIRMLQDILSQTFPVAPILEYIVYVAVAVLLSIWAFYKKELEF
jgi:ABC-type transport system involved in multi-copper enzyme maturation permease subunit